VVSMTFLRSAVFAIFAIFFLLTGMCRPPAGCGSTWYLGSNSGVLPGRVGALQ